MAKQLPYLASPGTITKAFEKIKSVPTPSRVTQDFVKTKLQIKGGSGSSMTSFLKKVGFVNPDGTPSELYLKYRNPATSGAAVAKAIMIGYAPLYEHNEYMQELSDEEIKGLIIQVTGCAEDARTLQLTISCIKYLKELAEFDQTLEEPEEMVQMEPEVENKGHRQQISQPEKGVELNLSYMINLNLPATSDIAVFDAIFKSLQENILKK